MRMYEKSLLKQKTSQKRKLQDLLWINSKQSPEEIITENVML